MRKYITNFLASEIYSMNTPIYIAEKRAFDLSAKDPPKDQNGLFCPILC